jgi:16S rRNA (cytosine967-C5)-methyltransferase
VLWVALYQMLFLERIPQFAAVNEAVQQAHRWHHRRQAGMINGVLRTILRSLTPPQKGRPPISREAIPTGPDSYRVADKPVFPSPQGDPAGYLAAAYSLPHDLARRWIEQFGGLDGAIPIAMQADMRAPLIVRVNRLRTGMADMLAGLRAAGIDAQPHANGHSIVLVDFFNVQDLQAFHEGLIQPQDPTATAVGLAAAPLAGQKVLDFCAAPGTKTTHMAELMDNKGAIVALDVTPHKLAAISANCRRLGIDIVTVRPAEEAGGLEPDSFDVVLADVPCTNTGVLARRAEARWRFSDSAMAGVLQTQRTLARAAAHFVRPGGRLVYSTCSIEPQECSAVAQWLVRNSPRLRLVREQLTLPAGVDMDSARWHDGGYYAVLQKD